MVLLVHEQGKPDNTGVIPRTLDVLFNSIQSQPYQGPAICPRFFSDVAFLDAKEAQIQDKIKDEFLSLYKLVRVLPP
jgi:hypothetical protein